MGLGRRVLVLLCVLASWPVRPALAEDSVVWLVGDFPPVFIRSPALAGQGYGDRQLAFLVAHLGGFRHTLGEATPPRLWHEIEHGDGFCTLAAYRTPEREKVARFASAHFMVPPSSVIIRADRLGEFHAFLDRDGAIDLGLLAASDQFSGAFVPRASYGAAIDAFVQNPARKTKLAALATRQLPLTALARSRVDFLFGFYIEVKYYKEIEKISEDFIALPVKGNPAHGHSWIACSDGPIGRKVIERIDALLSRDDAMTAFLTPLGRWYEPKDFEATMKVKSSD